MFEHPYFTYQVTVAETERAAEQAERVRAIRERLAEERATPRRRRFRGLFAHRPAAPVRCADCPAHA
ncbi:hypothetical protein [Microbacterium sp.]|uniref:hypothetical protein n=1 Tax=Microbacterium sp. TaxID=51671 RepID=UPI003340F70B